MRRALRFALGVVLLGAVLTSMASAATEAQKLNGIVNGLAHLDVVKCTATATTTYWAYGGCGGFYPDAFTGAAIFAFLSQKGKWPTTPASIATAYAADVTNGVNYLLSVASTSTVTVNSNNVAVCAGGAASCTAVYWNVSSEPVYSTGFVASALGVYGLAQGASAVAATTGPLAGYTWLQVMQGIVNAYAAGQATTVNGNRNGGWRYSIPSGGDADMSTTQWGAIATGYAQAVGAVAPAFLKTNLQVWLAYDLYNGTSACYYGSTECSIGPTNAENGAWLVSNAFAGGASNAAGPIAFLNTNWKTTPNSTWYGNFGHTYAMWSTYKGLESTIGLADNTHITNLNSTCGAPNNLPASGICNWWEDYNQWLVTNQSSTDGSGNIFWAGDSDEAGWTDPMSTAVFTAILGAAALPTTITNGGNPVAVPTLSKWGLVVLAILLVGFAAMRLRGTRTA